MPDDASRKAFEKWVQKDPERAFKPLTIWQDARNAALAESAKVIEEAERIIERHQEERRLIRMNYCAAVYDVTLNLESQLALAAIRALKKGE